MGGPKVPAVGFAAGIERMMLESKQQPTNKSIDVYISCNDIKHASKGFKIIKEITDNGYKIFFDTNKKNVKNQIKDAVKNKASSILIIDDKILIRNLSSKKENIISESQILSLLKKQ